MSLFFCKKHSIYRNDFNKTIIEVCQVLQNFHFGYMPCCNIFFSFSKTKPMPAQHLFIIYFISFLLLLLPSFGAAKMFEKAGVKKWKAFVPFYNTWIMQVLGGRSKHWVFWQIIPVAGWFITLGIYIEFVKLFNRVGFFDHVLTSFATPFYFAWLGYSDKIKFAGSTTLKKYKKPAWREWIDAAVFAVVAATLIRAFVFEAYAIPSGSMEKTLMVNEYLFVNKISYGPRVPNTPLALPFIHNYIPGTSLKSYTSVFQLGYIRWFTSPVKRGSPVVFNVPIGDTVINKEDFQTVRPYYDIKRAAENGNQDAFYILSHPAEYPLAIHPFDKADNYVKRCVAIAGDILEIKKGIIFINGVAQPAPLLSQMRYEVITHGQTLDQDVMKEEYGIDILNPEEFQVKAPNDFEMLLTANAVSKMKQSGLASEIKPVLDIPGDIRYKSILFPYDSIHQWTLDDYGPLWIPKKGAILQLTEENFSIYERAIKVYEHNMLEKKHGKFYINGQQTNSYTFKMDYYWMMGDNRHNSQDSRFWGIVPEDRIVGKPSFIFFSYDHGPRWKRLFKRIE